MPGYVTHLSVGEQVIAKCKIKDTDYINSFLIGSIIPDIFKGNDKKKSHFWTDDTYKLFERKPDLEGFLRKYSSKLSNPYVLGYYAHLLLDYEFMEKYWTKHFSFFNDRMEEEKEYEKVTRVLLKDEGKVYLREEFFSEKMYYGDYDRMNLYLIAKYNIRQPEITSIESAIEELDISNAKKGLSNMLTLISNKKGQALPPELKVFKLKELEELIENVSDIISNQIKC